MRSIHCWKTKFFSNKFVDKSELLTGISTLKDTSDAAHKLTKTHKNGILITKSTVKKCFLSEIVDKELF